MQSPQKEGFFFFAKNSRLPAFAISPSFAVLFCLRRFWRNMTRNHSLAFEHQSYKEHHMDSKPSEKRFALIIDADNVSAKYIKPITDELSKYGTITYKRIYGDWTSHASREMEGRPAGELHHAHPAVQLHHRQKRHRLGHDHRRHGHPVHRTPSRASASCRAIATSRAWPAASAKAA